jgi:hypothetical protein
MSPDGSGVSMSRLRVVLTTGLLALLLSASSCVRVTAPHAADAMQGARGAIQNKAPLDDMLSRRRTLANLPREEFTDEDWAARLALLKQIDEAIMAATISDTDAAIATQAPGVANDAAAITAQTTAADVNREFVADLQEVTVDAVKSVACDEMLNVLAPDETPPEPGAASTPEQAAEAALTKLGARWTGVGEAVDWLLYANSVATAAQRYAESIDGYSTERVPNPNPGAVLVRPQVARAAVVYLRACYSPPKKP